MATQKKGGDGVSQAATGEDEPWNVRYRSGRDALTDEEIRKLMASCRTREEETLLSLAIASGMRREDIVAVKVGEIQDLTSESEPAVSIKFWEKKKRRWYVVRIGGTAARNVLSRIHELKRSQWLFPSHHSARAHLASRSAYNILHRVLARANLRPRPFHSLRATCIKQCKRLGWSMEEVMEHTGDSWRTVQEHYLTPTYEEMTALAKRKPLV